MIKGILICLLFFPFSTSALAKDSVVPEAFKQEVGEYQNFWKHEIDSSNNHVIWKLFVYSSVLIDNPMARNKWQFIFAQFSPQGYQFNPQINFPTLRPNQIEKLITGLTSKPDYFVLLDPSVFIEYPFPVPKKGDVLAIDGEISKAVTSTYRNIDDDHNGSPQTIKALMMSIDNAVKLLPESTGSTLTAISSPTAIPAKYQKITPTPSGKNNRLDEEEI